MEQWLIEGKFTEEEVLMQSCDMLAAGIDTVSPTCLWLYFGYSGCKPVLNYAADYNISVVACAPTTVYHLSFSFPQVVSPLPSLQTTNTSTFMLHELAKNPTLQDRVCEEIRSVMGGRESPTFQDLQKMSLIRGCVKETLRYCKVQ